jgi:predicted metalloprotease
VLFNRFGDTAPAISVAHENGHHIQLLLGVDPNRLTAARPSATRPAPTRTMRRPTAPALERARSFLKGYPSGRAVTCLR